MTEWDKSIGVVVAEIKMMDASSKGLYWLVEGPSDIRFFSSRVTSDIQLVVGGGKRNVIGAIAALSTDPVNNRILGIVDSDIDWLMPEYVSRENIIATDPRDLEGLLLRSSAYNKVLAEFADAQKVQRFETLNGCSVLEYVAGVARCFGQIRAVNDLNTSVSLKKFKPQSFMDKVGWKYRIDEAFQVAVDKGVCSSVDELQQKIQKLPDVDIWNYVRGHDAVNIFVGGLLSELGRGGKIDGERLGLVLRSGIDEAEYTSTKLYQSIIAWHEMRQSASK